jgi:RNA polymerase sigma-70 factor (ECF subfamily)
LAAQPSTMPSIPAAGNAALAASREQRAAAQHPHFGSPEKLEATLQHPVAIIPPMRWEELSDETLIARFQAEADSSLAEQYVNELFRRHHAKIARWCFSVTGDRESAADLAQEICVKAYQNLSHFKGQSKFTTWLYAITRNHCLNAIRSRAAAPAMDSDETIVNALPDLAQENPQAAVERKQLAGIARQFVNEALDETERVVFTMHFAEELPLDVITRMLKLENASGAKAYLVSAKRKLERVVKRWKAKA